MSRTMLTREEFVETVTEFATSDHPIAAHKKLVADKDATCSRIKELEDGMRRIYAGSLGEGFPASIAKKLTECS